MKKLIESLACPRAAYLNQFGLVGEKEKLTEIAILLKKSFTENDLSDLANFNFTDKLVKDFFDNEDEELFSMDKEKEQVINLLVKRINLIAKELYSMGVKIIDKNINVKEKIKTRDVFHKFDLALTFPNNSKTYLVNIYQTHPSAKQNMNTYDAAALEYLTKEELAKKIYGNDIAIASILVTTDKKEEDINFSNYFIVSNFALISDTRKKEIEDLRNSICSSLINKKSPCEGDIYKDCATCPVAKLCNYYETNINDLEIVEVEKTAKNAILTKTQENLCEVDGGKYVVVAGAGTGKTYTLVNRALNLVQKGLDPKDILIITFGEKSVQEIKDKLNFVLKMWFITEITADDFNIFTFNAFGQKIIEENFAEFGYSDKPKLIDKVTKMDIIKTLLDSFPEIEGLNYLDPLANYFGNKSGALLKVEDYIDSSLATEFNPIEKASLEEKWLKELGPSSLNILKDIKQEYLKFIKKNNLLTYEIQIHALVECTTNQFNHILEKYAFPEIIIDEFQDTNLNQLSFVKALTTTSKFKTLIMVGDDSQSIYSWRGADKTIILNLDKHFDKLNNVKMVENFRSTKQIIDLANKFNELDKSVTAKQLTSQICGEDVDLIDASRKGTFNTVLKEIKDQINNGRKYCDIGVIAKTHYELEQIYQLLQKNNIPSFISAHECFKDNPKVKNLSDFAKFLKNPEKTLYLAEYLQVKDFAKFNKQADLGRYVGIEQEKIKKEIENLDDKELLNYFMEELKTLAEEDKVLKELVSILETKSFNNILDVSDYLNKLKIYDSDIGLEKDETAYNAITLMTAHAAKGREFPVIIGVLDKFTSSSNDSHQCVFVTITRAREKLILIQDKKRTTSKAIYYDAIKDLLNQ